MNVVGYLRVSTENQRKEGTIEIQKKELISYAKLNGLNIVKFFCDEGYSGVKDLENRPGLCELFEYFETNSVDAIVFWKLDRLARDLYIQESLIQQIQKYNVRLISTKEKDLDSSDPMRKAFRQFLGIIAELEKEFITMRLTAGRLRKAEQGKYAGGKPAFGYKSVEGDLKIDSQNHKTIKKIFYMSKRKKMSLGKIAKELNDKGIPTAQGGKWYSSTVKYILENKVYRGVSNYKHLITKRLDLSLI